MDNAEEQSQRCWIRRAVEHAGGSPQQGGEHLARCALCASVSPLTRSCVRTLSPATVPRVALPSPLAAALTQPLCVQIPHSAMSNIIPDTELGSIEVEVPHTPPAAAAAAAVTTGSGSAAAPTPASPLRQRGASRSATDRSYGATTEPASAGNGSAQITVQPAPDSARRSSPGKDQAAGSAAPGAMDLLSPEGGGARGGRKSSLGSSPQNRRLSRQNTLQRGKITGQLALSTHTRTQRLISFARRS